MESVSEGILRGNGLDSEQWRNRRAAADRMRSATCFCPAGFNSDGSIEKTVNPKKIINKNQLRLRLRT